MSSYKSSIAVLAILGQIRSVEYTRTFSSHLCIYLILFLVIFVSAYLKVRQGILVQTTPRLKAHGVNPLQQTWGGLAKDF